jgi:hypothetical protein
MTTVRSMSGLVDYTGTTNANGIFVERMAPRRPSSGPRYFVRCTRCNSKWVADHQKMSYLTCRNATCRRAQEDAARALTHGKQTAPVHDLWHDADPDSMRHYLDATEQNR